MNVLFRADASITIGSGHIMRCLTLADVLHQQGATVQFACYTEPGDLCDFIEHQGYSVQRLSTRDARIRTSVEWLVVDHYALDASWEGQMRAYAKHMLVIDDLANRPHNCDVLLDQNLYHAMEHRYQDLVAPQCRQLLGPDYALLRPEFYQVRQTLAQRTGEIQRLLVFMGGSDPSNETTKALKAIQALKVSDWSIDVVVGNSNPNKHAIEQLCQKIPSTSFHCQVSNMAELMGKADLAIGAGGSACWERCCLGLPSLVVTIAENQKEVAQILHERSCHLLLGTAQEISSQLIEESLYNAMHNSLLMCNLSENGKILVDGIGTKKVSAYVTSNE
jgi:UDP-2,4-diacetamido-2,4,6-trideoxy-beta-L-altropyranose hydrolase